MKTDQTAARISEGRVITLQEAAVMLNVSYSTVLRLAVSGELPAFRMRNAWRTSTAVVSDFVRRRMDEQAILCKSVVVED